ncbi:hypothetical protein UFOVP724_117 [uncultured Caudovirales phage]|uniref:Uncharacterized protein n=1 Tax=uncultured Caudovirales phage TaxID=2100421 RepID=A0A6J5NRF9_9CAUD|nr:hypothetical protein UFOVP724_117 [uncultured Caudovirales phage]
MKQNENEKLKPIDEMKSAQQNALFICTPKGLKFLQKK